MLNIDCNFVGMPGNDSILLGSEAPGLINMLPLELILQIFENSKADLRALASVNHLWKDLTRTLEFYRAMFSPEFAARAFCNVDLKIHFGMDLGLDEVPRLRLKDYGEVEEGRALLTNFPKAIPIKNEDGTISWVPPSAKLIGELVKKPKYGYATCFDPDSYFPAINDPREIKGGEWVVTYKKPICPGKPMEVQITSAQNVGGGADVAVFEETIYAVFMHYVKTGERCFPRDPAKNDYSLIRFKEKIGNWRIVCGFGPSSLYVYYRDYAHVSGILRVAVARKSIGT